MTVLSWASVLLVSALTVFGCAGPYQGAPYAQGYGGNYYAPVPQNPYATPWVGPNTPWIYYQGDWFLNGMLYNYYGSQYGWAPYYAYPPTYIVRPSYWYEPKWNTWYQQHPEYRQTFTKKYPYWRDHHYGQRYDQDFYNRYHHGQGGGWQKGFHGSAMERPGLGPGPARMAPYREQRPGPTRMTPYQGQRPEPSQVTPQQGPRPGEPGRVVPQGGQGSGAIRKAAPEGQRPNPSKMAPYQGHKPGPAQVTPREGPRPGEPAQITPREGQKSRPARIAPSQGQKPEAAPRGGQKPGHDRVGPPEGQRPGSAQ